ncbi:hypothetical protein HHK36_019801 [Tetracentron sinense]|uniref:Uncharacterized protein n=1 Tax=Tetracentron sinense TaxID=13715 RepID=A0A834YX17_TETSI|nr:hypothetical protein HHK36_019801 [Tetracentron sinense]
MAGISSMLAAAVQQATSGPTSNAPTLWLFYIICYWISVLGERFKEIVGSPYYMAPEVLKRNYGPGKTEQGVAHAIIRSIVEFKRDPWPKVSDKAKDLVKRMLDPDPRGRLIAQEVLGISHPQVVAEHLSMEEVAGIKEAFQVMDTGSNGKINLKDLRVGLQNLGQQISDPDLQILMEAVISVHIRKMGNDDHLHKAFEFFYQNKSGYIEIEELRDALADEVDTNSEEVINAIIQEVDTDNVGATYIVKQSNK